MSLLLNLGGGSAAALSGSGSVISKGRTSLLPSILLSARATLETRGLAGNVVRSSLLVAARGTSKGKASIVSVARLQVMGLGATARGGASLRGVSPLGAAGRAGTRGALTAAAGTTSLAGRSTGVLLGSLTKPGAAVILLLGTGLAGLFGRVNVQGTLPMQGGTHRGTLFSRSNGRFLWGTGAASRSVHRGTLGIRGSIQLSGTSRNGLLGRGSTARTAFLTVSAAGVIKGKTGLSFATTLISRGYSASRGALDLQVLLPLVAVSARSLAALFGKVGVSVFAPFMPSWHVAAAQRKNKSAQVPAYNEIMGQSPVIKNKTITVPAKNKVAYVPAKE